MTLKRRINTHMRVNYQCIPHGKIIDAGFALGNANCHHNAVAAARAGRAAAVWLVWAGHGDQGAVHFINSKDGQFFDETWHDESSRQDYYIIRKVRPDEYDDVYDLLVDCKWMLANLLANPWQRWRMLNSPHRYMWPQTAPPPSGAFFCTPSIRGRLPQTFLIWVTHDTNQGQPFKSSQ